MDENRETNIRIERTVWKIEMKRVLILNISHNELRMINALKELGYYVIGTGGVPGLIGEKHVDEYIKADYSDKELMLLLAIDKKVDAVCACCNDFGVLSAAWVAEKLGLPGHDSYENAMILHHKDLFKKFARKNGIQTPLAVYFDNIPEAKMWLGKAIYPIIIKPVDLTGGKGVHRADNFSEAVKAIEDAFVLSRAKHIVIEPFIEGTQHAICTFLRNQKVIAVGSNNEYSFENPYKVEIDTYPADNIYVVQSFLVSQIEKMAQILHLNDGIFHMQYRMKDDQPWIIEPMRRILGNLYGIPCEGLNNLNWDMWQAKAYCGDDLSEFPKNVSQSGYWAYRTVMCRRNGMVKGIHVDESIRKYIFDEFMTWKKGDIIENHLSESLGFYFMKFDSKEEMDHIMLDRYDDIYAIME